MKKNELSKEAKEARNKYHREWRKNNPDKVKKHKKTYWEKKARELAPKEATTELQYRGL